MATATARALGGLLHDLTDDELLTLTASDNRPSLKKYLAERMKLMWHLVSYDRSVGLVALIHRAVGSGNIRNVNTNITPEHFSLNGTGIRSVKCRVEAYLDGETSEEAARRFTAAGYSLGNTADLTGFLHDHPDQVAKWSWVLAISEDSRWAGSDGGVCVPYASVCGANRRFCLYALRDRLNSSYGVLLLSE